MIAVVNPERSPARYRLKCRPLLSYMNSSFRIYSTRWFALALLAAVVAFPAVAVAQTAATMRAAVGAVVGRARLAEEERQALDRLAAAAGQQEDVRAALVRLEEVRAGYLENRRKFPAERDPLVERAYRQAESAAAGALKAAMLKIDPVAAAQLLGLIDGTVRRLNEGEGANDSDVPENPAMARVVDVAGLPRVLLIGDSISIGYTVPMRALLDGKANVHRIPVNGGATEVGLERIDAWLGNGRWDVIHFNFGLHDAKYMSTSEQRASREVYLGNLQRLIDRMKATGAKLVFATTTPVPPILQHGIATGTRVFDSIPERNALAAALMSRNGVAINDLYTVVTNAPADAKRDNDVHFSPEGYDLLAAAVAASIQAQLPGH
jgi:lysophospholipase L1-like esterase